MHSGGSSGARREVTLFTSQPLFERKRGVFTQESAVKQEKTQDSRLSSAELCRRNGWHPGTVLRGMECGRYDVIQITAVGDRDILAKILGGQEQHWTLCCREWEEVIEKR